VATSDKWFLALLVGASAAIGIMGILMAMTML
jgi:hypothetical protein